MVWEVDDVVWEEEIWFERLIRCGLGGYRCGLGGFHHAGKAPSLSRS